MSLHPPLALRSAGTPGTVGPPRSLSRSGLVLLGLGLAATDAARGQLSQCDQTETQILQVTGKHMFDDLGAAVALDGSVAIVGNPAADNGGLEGSDFGAATIYVYGAGNWFEIQTLTGLNDPDLANMGSSVALDDDVAVVGVPGGAISKAGLARVYRFNGLNSWVLEGTLQAPVADANPLDQFGTSCAIDGNTIAVGASFDDEAGSDSGAVYVFGYDGSQWLLQQKLLRQFPSPGDLFGSSVALEDGVLAVGAPGSVGGLGSVTVFRDPGSGFVHETVLRELGRSEIGISLAMDSGAILTGAVSSAFLYRDVGGTWELEQTLGLVSGPINVAISGDTVVLGELGSEAHLYRRSGGTWFRVLNLTAADPNDTRLPGASVALDGVLALVGDPDQGHASDVGGGVYAYDVSEVLGFTASPPSVSIGQTLDLVTCGGIPGHFALMFLVGVDGVPLFQSLGLSGTFDASGVWTLSGPYGGFDGAPVSLSLQVLAQGSTGKVVASKVDGLTLLE